MNQKKIYFFAMGLAMCCGVLFGPAPVGHAASNTKSTTSFSYSSKVVGNTVVISGNSTTSTSNSSAAKSTVSKSPATVRPPASSKTTVTKKSPASQKQPVVKTPAKKPAAAPSTKTTHSLQSLANSSQQKPNALMRSTSKTVVNYFIPTRKPAAPIIFKLSPKPAPTATVKVITKTTPKVTTPPKKITVKIPAVSGSKVNTASGEASFTPESITAAAFPPAVAVSDPVYLSAPASAHYRIGTILGKTAQVRFTPIDSTWSFGDGSTGAGLNPTHTFLTPGKFSATVAVRYQVSYRFTGETAWNNEAGQITLTDQVQITVSGAQNAVSPQGPPAASKPYLVGENCLTNPLAFAC